MSSNGFHLQKLSFSSFFQIKFWTFFKKIQKESASLLKYFLKTNLLLYGIIPQIQFFLDFSQGFMPFCKNKVRKD